MRGGFLHTRVMAERLTTAFQALGARVSAEHWVAHNNVRGAIDLWVIWRNFGVAVEIECSPDRVPRDIAKARAAQARALIIVVPDSSVAAAVRRSLGRFAEASPDLLRIRVATFGQVLQRLRSGFITVA